MDINTSNSKEGNETSDGILKAKNKILSYLKIRITEITNSIEGESPDEKGYYTQNYYDAKDYRDQLNRFSEIVESEVNNLSASISVEDFLQSVCKKIQNFHKESYEQFLKFIEGTFGFKAKPLDNPPIIYTAWLNYYSKEYRVTPEEVGRVMPYKLFQKFEQSNDTAARIRLMMDNFGEPK